MPAYLPRWPRHQLPELWHHPVPVPEPRPSASPASTVASTASTVATCTFTVSLATKVFLQQFDLCLSQIGIRRV